MAKRSFFSCGVSSTSSSAASRRRRPNNGLQGHACVSIGTGTPQVPAPPPVQASPHPTPPPVQASPGIGAPLRYRHSPGAAVTSLSRSRWTLPRRRADRPSPAVSHRRPVPAEQNGTIDGRGMRTGAAKALRQRPRRASPSSSASLSPSGPVLTAGRGRRRAAAPRGALALLPPAAAAAMLPPHVGPPRRQQGSGHAPDSAYWLCAAGSRLLLALRHRLPVPEARPAPPRAGGRAVTRL